MKQNRKFLFILFIFSLFLTPLSGREDYRIEPQAAAMEAALELPSSGVLKRRENGFVYLDVSNGFIDKVVPLISCGGVLHKRPTAPRSLGAHISVFHEREEVIPEELESPFNFAVKEIRSFTIHTRDGLKRLFAIAVESEELEELRAKYGCTSKLKGYDFHITLGKQLPSASENWERVECISPWESSDEPTEGLMQEGDFVAVDCEEILATAAKVDAVAQLKLKRSGYAYLDVDNAFVDAVWQKLPLQGEFSPQSTGPKKMGAHISVLYEDEMIGKEIWNLEEAGQWFTFEVKELRYIDKKTAKGQKRLWILAVEAPSLERLRKHYGLRPKLQGHDFHITIGYEESDALPYPSPLLETAPDSDAFVPIPSAA